MPQIIITNLFNKTLNLDQKKRTLLEAVHSQGLDWMHACGGKGRCTTCKVKVEQGMDQLSQLSVAEQKFTEKSLLTTGERLACQAVITGDVIITIPDENKFPHIEYSD